LFQGLSWLSHCFARRVARRVNGKLKGGFSWRFKGRLNERFSLRFNGRLNERFSLRLNQGLS
jgi:hypothetical protein